LFQFGEGQNWTIFTKIETKIKIQEPNWEWRNDTWYNTNMWHCPAISLYHCHVVRCQL